MGHPLAAADRNLVQAWRRISSLGPRPGAHEHDGVVHLTSGIDHALFNPTFVVGDVHDPTTVVEATVAHYAPIGVPFELVFRDEAAPGLSDACERAGLVEHWRMPLMVLDPVPDDDTDEAPRPDGLEIVTVDDSNVDDYADVLAAGFGMPSDLAALLGPGMLADPGFTGFLGLLDGEPAGSSALYVTDGTAGVYNVATVARFGRRGVGTALTWAASHAARREHGLTRAILQASRAGEPVYARMGFTTPDRYRQFEGPPPTPSRPS